MCFAAKFDRNGKIFDGLWTLAMKIFNKCELQVLLQETDKHERNVLHLVLLFNNEAFFTSLINVIKSLFKEKNQKKFFRKLDVFKGNIFHLTALNYSNFGLITAVWNFSKTILSHEELKLMLRQKNADGENVLQSLAIVNNVDVLNEFLEIVEKTFTVEEKKELLTARRSDFNQNVLRLIARYNQNESVLKIVWKFVENIFTSDELKTMLKETDENGRNAFHLGVVFNNKNFFESFIEIIKNLLDFEEQKVLLKSCDAFNGNIFHFAALNNSNSHIITAVWNYSKRFLSNEELKFMFIQKNADGENILHSLVFENHVEALNEFLQVVQHVFSKEEQKHYLRQIESKFNQNILYLIATHNDNKNVLSTFWEFAKSLFQIEELKTFLKETGKSEEDERNWEFWLKKSFVFEELYKICKTTFDFDERKYFFSQKDSKKNNIFHSAAKSGDNSIFPTLWDCLKEVLLQKEIESMLKERNDDGFNVLHVLIKENQSKMLNNFLTFSNKTFDSSDFKPSKSEDFKVFLTEKSSNHLNILQIAARYKNESFMKNLLAILMKVFETSNEEHKKLFLDLDENGKNLLQIAASNENKNVTQRLWNFMSKLLSIDELLVMLRSDGLEEIALKLVEDNGNEEVNFQLRNLLKILNDDVAMESFD